MCIRRSLTQLINSLNKTHIHELRPKSKQQKKKRTYKNGASNDLGYQTRIGSISMVSGVKIK